MLKNKSLEAPWGHFLAWELKMLKNMFVEADWGYFLAWWLKTVKDTPLEVRYSSEPRKYDKTEGL